MPPPFAPQHSAGSEKSPKQGSSGDRRHSDGRSRNTDSRERPARGSNDSRDAVSADALTAAPATAPACADQRLLTATTQPAITPISAAQLPSLLALLALHVQLGRLLAASAAAARRRKRERV